MTMNNISPQTIEAVALALTDKCLQGVPLPVGKEKVLSTYAECLEVVRGKSPRMFDSTQKKPNAVNKANLVNQNSGGSDWMGN